MKGYAAKHETFRAKKSSQLAVCRQISPAEPPAPASFLSGRASAPSSATCPTTDGPFAASACRPPLARSARTGSRFIFSSPSPLLHATTARLRPALLQANVVPLLLHDQSFELAHKQDVGVITAIY